MATPTFLGLPLELRLQVYGHVWSSDTALPAKMLIKQRHQTWVLRSICQQTRAETSNPTTLGLSIRNNAFLFSGPADLKARVSFMSLSTALLITRVYIQKIHKWAPLLHEAPIDVARLQILQRLPNLSELTILNDHIEPHSWRVCAMPIGISTLTNEATRALDALPADLPLSLVVKMYLMLKTRSGRSMRWLGRDKTRMPARLVRIAYQRGVGGVWNRVEWAEAVTASK